MMDGMRPEPIRTEVRFLGGPIHDQTQLVQMDWAPGRTPTLPGTVCIQYMPPVQIRLDEDPPVTLPRPEQVVYELKFVSLARGSKPRPVYVAPGYDGPLLS